jgi:hypothetical protein
MTTTDLNKLNIHYLTKAQYDGIVEKDPNALYFTNDSPGDIPRIINLASLAAPTSMLTISLDSDGNAFSLRKAHLLIEIPAVVAEPSVKIRVNDIGANTYWETYATSYKTCVSVGRAGANCMRGTVDLDLCPSGDVFMFSNALQVRAETVQTSFSFYTSFLSGQNVSGITSVTLLFGDLSDMPIGTTIKLEGYDV